MNNTKGLKNGLDFDIRDFDRQVTNIHRTDGNIGNGNWDGHFSVQQRGPLKKPVSVFNGLESEADFSTSQELHS